MTATQVTPLMTAAAPNSDGMEYCTMVIVILIVMEYNAECAWCGRCQNAP